MKSEIAENNKIKEIFKEMTEKEEQAVTFNVITFGEQVAQETRKACYEEVFADIELVCFHYGVDDLKKTILWQTDYDKIKKKYLEAKSGS